MGDTLWGDTKTWVKRNPTLSGAIGGFAAGSVIPGLGNIVGAVGGAVIGHMAGKDGREREDHEVKMAVAKKSMSKLR